jgi:hypothetical protein
MPQGEILARIRKFSECWVVLHWLCSLRSRVVIPPFTGSPVVAVVCIRDTVAICSLYDRNGIPTRRYSITLLRRLHTSVESDIEAHRNEKKRFKWFGLRYDVQNSMQT